MCWLESGVGGGFRRIEVRQGRIVDITVVGFRDGGAIVVQKAMCVGGVVVVAVSTITRRLGSQWDAIVSALQ